MKTNVTLKLDADLLREARVVAAVARTLADANFPSPKDRPRPESTRAIQAFAPGSCSR